jgi:hypothetical protein
MNLIELFCDVDDFLRIFLKAWNKQLIANGEKARLRQNRLSMSEIVTILIFFHSSHFRDFKHYYLLSVCGELRTYFPGVLSYNRFVALIPMVIVPLCAYLQSRRRTTKGISFIDSTSIIVCHNKRIYGHKVFKNFAKLGKTTKGWFYGFKLHLVCNHAGELIDCKFTAGNVDDRVPVPDLAKDIVGKLFGDKGYISQTLFEKLLERGLKLITGLKKNMKNKLMELFDKLMLRKRALIESINNQLKNVFHLEHTRHRSPVNGFINMVAAVVAYTHHSNKPSIELSKREIAMLQKLAA